MKPTINAVIFDFGGVFSFSQNQELVAKIKNILGIEGEIFNKSYAKHRYDYDIGNINEYEYWLRIAGENGVFVGEAELRQLAFYDMESWLQINNKTIELQKMIKRDGIKTAILSNMPFNILAHMKKTLLWLNEFDKEIYSCNLGYGKPDKRIFQKCCTEINIKPEKCLFIDDIKENIEVAKNFGMNTHLFEDNETLETDIMENYILEVV